MQCAQEQAGAGGGEKKHKEKREKGRAGDRKNRERNQDKRDKSMQWLTIIFLFLSCCRGREDGSVRAKHSRERRSVCEIGKRGGEKERDKPFSDDGLS